MEKIKSGILWVRESTEDQGKGFNPAQLGKCKAFAEKENIIIPEDGIFDIDETGWLKKRRIEFDKMLEYIKTNNIENIICFTIDRAGRNMPDAVRIYNWAMLPDHFFHTITEGLTLWAKASAFVKKAFYTAFVDAQFSSEVTSEKTIEGMGEIFATGNWPHGVPIGYLRQENENGIRQIIIDPIAGPLVKIMFELYDSGRFSHRGLTKEMERRGLRSKETPKEKPTKPWEQMTEKERGRAELKEKKRRRSQPVCAHGIHYMLKNRFYTGQQRWVGGEWKDGLHPALVSKELFFRVQDHLTESRLNLTSERRPNGTFPFRPFLKCQCGCSLTAGRSTKTVDGKPRIYDYYFCTKKRGACNQKNYKPEEIDKILVKGVHDIYLYPDTLDNIKSEIERDRKENDGANRAEIKSKRIELGKEKVKVKILLDQLLEGKFPKELLDDKLGTINKNVAKIEADIDALENKVNPKWKIQALVVIEALCKFKSTYEKAPVEKKVQALEAMLEKVVLDDNGSPTFYWREPFKSLFEISEAIEKKLARIGRKDLLLSGSGKKSFCQKKIEAPSGSFDPLPSYVL